MRLSIVVPVLDEAALVAASLSRLAPLRAAGHQVVLADGGSRDATVAAAGPCVDRVVLAPRGRAVQMNAGAAAADGDALLFLHVDTTLPEGAAEVVCERLAASGNAAWGRFDLALSGPGAALRVIGAAINVRSRLTGIATGDQAIFVSRPLFERIGGFPEIALMEDVALSRRLRRERAPLCLRQRVVSSSRRWERDGVARTVLLMWRLRLAYWLGADPARLARRYH